MAASSGSMLLQRHVSWCPNTRQIARRQAGAKGGGGGGGLGLGSNQIDLNVTGNTPRAYLNASMAVMGRSAPQRPADEDLLTLALTSRSKDRWREEQAQLTQSIATAYGYAGAGVSAKKLGLQEEATVANAEAVRAEWVPKVRGTVRAMQETLRLKRLAASNPLLQLPGTQAKAREELNDRQEAAVYRLQAVARGLSARREAKNRLSDYRARKAVNAMASRVGVNLRVRERV
jgi:hypothetical protein